MRLPLVTLEEDSAPLKPLPLTTGLFGSSSTDNLRFKMSDEEQLVLAFVLPERRSRYLEFLRTAKGREKFRKTLTNFRAWDKRFTRIIAPGSQNPKNIEQILLSLGAHHTCYVISDVTDLDGHRIPLASALCSIVGYSYGSVLSCVPGILAYYEGEGERCLLYRR